MRQHDQRPARGHHGNGGFRRFRHRQFRRALEAEDRFGIAVAQVIGNLARLQHHVQRHDGRAGLEDAEIDRGKVRQVGAQKRDVVAAPDAGRRKRVGNLVGPRVELRVGEPLVAADERLGVWPTPHVLLEHGREVQHGVADDVNSPPRVICLALDAWREWFADICTMTGMNEDGEASRLPIC